MASVVTPFRLPRDRALKHFESALEFERIAGTCTSHDQWQGGLRPLRCARSNLFAKGHVRRHQMPHGKIVKVDETFRGNSVRGVLRGPALHRCPQGRIRLAKLGRPSSYDRRRAVGWTRLLAGNGRYDSKSYRSGCTATVGADAQASAFGVTWIALQSPKVFTRARILSANLNSLWVAGHDICAATLVYSFPSHSTCVRLSY